MARMTTYDNRHSRMVAWLKIVLPLVALAILSTLFLVSRRLDTSGQIPYSDVDVETLAREQRITAPNYAGVTRDGAAITITAEAARPGVDEPESLTTQRLQATIDTPDGARVEIAAGQGTIDTAGQTAHLSGGVEIETSSGYRVTTDALRSRLDATRVESAGEVTATGPLGRLRSGRMTLGQRNATAGPYVLHFTDGVDLLYEPPE